MGVPAILFCFVWLYISSAGPGPWSLDALRKSKLPRGISC
jgi:putative oxidoreductase